ncbi:hypothetical protein BLNAU_8866 [Blattamonas nauphoetae]|uniref:Uncharacterized protein n=1 Tax=Blattamonas nauphoetae TaxID=2049346 RepID=A0ABQ9XX71_9EUKA|nr:hypothetical protein BLNAU_8866 [Blattamonas nauphoetae]
MNVFEDEIAKLEILRKKQEEEQKRAEEALMRRQAIERERDAAKKAQLELEAAQKEEEERQKALEAERAAELRRQQLLEQDRQQQSQAPVPSDAPAPPSAAPAVPSAPPAAVEVVEAEPAPRPKARGRVEEERDENGLTATDRAKLEAIRAKQKAILQQGQAAMARASADPADRLNFMLNDAKEKYSSDGWIAEAQSKHPQTHISLEDKDKFRDELLVIGQGQKSVTNPNRPVPQNDRDLKEPLPMSQLTATFHGITKKCDSDLGRLNFTVHPVPNAFSSKLQGGCEFNCYLWSDYGGSYEGEIQDNVDGTYTCSVPVHHHLDEVFVYQLVRVNKHETTRSHIVGSPFGVYWPIDKRYNECVEPFLLLESSVVNPDSHSYDMMLVVWFQKMDKTIVNKPGENVSLKIIDRDDNESTLPLTDLGKGAYTAHLKVTKEMTYHAYPVWNGKDCTKQCIELSVSSYGVQSFASPG